MPQEKHSSADLLPLFPPIEPYQGGMLELDAPHRMYFEQSSDSKLRNSCMYAAIGCRLRVTAYHWRWNPDSHKGLAAIRPLST